MKSENGNPCHDCEGFCCYEGPIRDKTMLSVIDIYRIERFTGMKKDDFTENTRERVSGKDYLTLKYIKGSADQKHCIFFDEMSTLCKVHDYKPGHCKLYPIEGECVVGKKFDRNKLIHLLNAAAAVSLIV
jgi:Fe-S-cluster containining protein